MNKIKELFNEHWEKLLLGIVGLFCFYSLGISFVGMFGASNEEFKINELNTEIKSALLKGPVPKIDTKEKAVEEFQKKFELREGFSAYDKILPVRLFSEEAKVNPLEHVQDIARGHTGANSTPGPNCEKFYCKVNGENICLVCGAKGDREYIARAPKLTDIKLLRANMQTALEKNPYLDRQVIRIIWEDDVETDRTVFKVRKANVYRIEVTDENQKILQEMENKQSYQKEMKDFILDKKNNVKTFMKKGVILELNGENVGGSLYKAPLKNNEAQAPIKDNNSPGDIFAPKNNDKPEEKPETPKEVPAVDTKLHRLHDDKVFFNFEDTDFEPLKRYRYVLLEIFTGESAVRKPLSEWRFSKPVEVITGAENIFYLTRISPELDEQKNKIQIDGKDVYNADFRIYQYVKIQNCFYKKDFGKIKIGENIGSVFRTPMKKDKNVFLKGTDLKDEEWASWREMYPGSLRARKDRVELDLSYFTGFKILEIGEEKVKEQEKVGAPKSTNPKTYDEKGEEILKQEYREVEKVKQFAVLENTLNKLKYKIYRLENKEIEANLIENNVKEK